MPREGCHKVKILLTDCIFKVAAIGTVLALELIGINFKVYEIRRHHNLLDISVRHEHGVSFLSSINLGETFS